MCSPCITTETTTRFVPQTLPDPCPCPEVVEPVLTEISVELCPCPEPPVFDISPEVIVEEEVNSCYMEFIRKMVGDKFCDTPPKCNK